VSDPATKLCPAFSGVRTLNLFILLYFMAFHSLRH